MTATILSNMGGTKTASIYMLKKMGKPTRFKPTQNYMELENSKRVRNRLPQGRVR